jgi:hypothetical protein
MFPEIFQSFEIAGISDDSPEYLTISCERQRKFARSLHPGSSSNVIETHEQVGDFKEMVSLSLKLDIRGFFAQSE